MGKNEKNYQPSTILNWWVSEQWISGCHSTEVSLPMGGLVHAYSKKLANSSPPRKEGPVDFPPPQKGDSFGDSGQTFRFKEELYDK